MHIIHRPQRPRSVPAFTPLPFSSTTITSVPITSSTTTTHAHRPAGGNIGGNISGSPGANLGPPAPTSIPVINGGEPTEGPPAVPPLPTTASPNAPTSSSTSIVISIPSSQAPSPSNGGSSLSVQFGPGTIASGSSFGTPTLGNLPQPVATNGGSGTQVLGGPLSGPALTQGFITSTLPAGQISTATVPPSNSPSQTDAVSATSKGSRGGVTAGGVAGTLGVLALISLAIFLFVLRRRRVMRATHEETPTIREVMTPPLPLQRESDLMTTSPIPQYKHQSYVPTAEPSAPPQMHPDTPKRGPSPPPMTEINAHPQTVPTLVLNNARYRRNNNRLSIRIEEPKVDAHTRRSGAYGLTPFEDPSPVSPQSSDTSAYRTASSTVRGPGASPASSQTSLQVPPSPRTPTRRTFVIPPIPPLPKSPPPVPGVSINPFVDRNPFDDPPG